VTRPAAARPGGAPAGEVRPAPGAARLRGLHEFTGNPRFTPPWLGSSQREVTTLPWV
jgi:hypothetical protein